MINFIIYEDDKKYRELYISIILKVIGSMQYAYKITEIEKYDKNTMSKINKLVGKKIFIFDIEVPGKSGLDFAREIRNNGDWNSQMIVATTHEQLKQTTLTSRMLMLDFISKYYDLENSLKECLKICLNIVEHHNSLNFQYNGELYQIPYNDILYIDKDIEIKRTMSTIEKDLNEDDRFFRSHRSCIINLDNITSIELKDGVIHFGTKSTNLLSRDKKSELKEILELKVG